MGGVSTASLSLDGARDESFDGARDKRDGGHDPRPRFGRRPISLSRLCDAPPGRPERGRGLLRGAGRDVLRHMPVMRTGSLVAGIAVLAVAWLGPLPRLAAHSFAAHMTMHIAVVAVAAPLLALAMAGTRTDPVGVMPALAAPIPASMAELVVVWVWHVPALHHAARTATAAFVIEQGSFIVAGMLLWIAAIGGT